jgi:hypothetical protein
MPRGFLLDTEALLAARLPEGAPGSSRAFLQQARRERWIVCVAAPSLASVGARLARLRRSGRRGAHDYLWRWLDRLTSRHPQAVLPLDAAMAVTAAHLQSLKGAAPSRAVLAACALVHQLSIVTARPHRYEGLGVSVWPVCSPWPTPGTTPPIDRSLQQQVVGNRNSVAARRLCIPLGPVPGLVTRPSRLQWGYVHAPGWRARLRRNRRARGGRCSD